MIIPYSLGCSKISEELIELNFRTKKSSQMGAFKDFIITLLS